MPKFQITLRPAHTTRWSHGESVSVMYGAKTFGTIIVEAKTTAEILAKAREFGATTTESCEASILLQPGARKPNGFAKRERLYFNLTPAPEGW